MAAWKNAPEQGPERGVVGRPASTSAFDLTRWAPSPEAGRFVEHYWSVSWDRRADGPFESTVITFPAVHLTREWGDDVARHGCPLPNTLLHGVVTQVFRTTISARGTVVGARFRPGGFTARFGRDAGDLTGRVVPVDDDLFGGPIDLGQDVDGVRARLDAAIGAYRGPVDAVYARLVPLLERMRDDPTLHRVEQVMEHSPWSVRTTQRVFRRYVGVPVKWVLCRFRLQQAALEIESAGSVDFADLAVRLGWYDQAHFINDFRGMLGCTPGEYAMRFGQKGGGS
ncbi:AraC family transcriptional regulator [Mycolicibacterium goodii]|uniref:Helix-turn-helix domain-containing protein n=1 Tax=Mycolicibacterium goodii TaxID=134601 RepID=A0ABS6HTP6_MYCGD|nr:helix-turn-helix domain-containing protein [Mycolicibacterium goodii]MBU8820146.1 helix-turn-helix domain-containing protein [Mycolicibacterium goodii]MBU8826067.1 helix-turn-helix domain-containing protein [Mycolicibacterium goodii]MBU8839409.1 helix-turn-helix domain-containing protein [Mycolicibacterium goodii]